MRRSLLLLCETMLVCACASQAPQTAGTPSPGTDQNQTGGLIQNGQAGSGTCSGSKPASGLAFTEGQMRLAADKIRVYTDRNRDTESLCDVLNQTGKKVAIIQFAGVECLECQQTSQALKAALGTSRYSQYIAHVIVLTDFFQDYSDAKFDGFMTKYAPGDVRVFDEAILWKYYSQDPQTPDRATMIALSTTMDAVIYNHTGSKDQILPAAEALAQAALNSGARTP